MGDACSLVDAFRAGTISPTEALEGSLAAIESSELNAVCFVDEERAREAAAAADVSLPFGGVPMGVKELDPVRGWPLTEASLVFKDRVSTYDGTMTARLRQAGAVLVGQTTASEFGGINCTSTRLHGATSNPYDLAAHAGRLVGRLGGVGGRRHLPHLHRRRRRRVHPDPGRVHGDLRVEVHLRAHPQGPAHRDRAAHRGGRLPVPFGARHGPLVRRLQRVRRARPLLPAPGRGLGGGAGTTGRPGQAGGRVPDLGAAVIASGVREKVEEAADLLIKDAGLERVDVPIALPRGGLEWALAGTASLLVGLGDLYPGCESELTPEIMLAANIATNHFNVDTAKNIEAFRRSIIVQMAQIFEQVDFVVCATNPDVAFGAQGPMPTTVDGVDLVAAHGFEAAVGNNGALDHPGEHDGASGRRHPDRPRRRVARLHADHRPPPRRAAAVGPGPDRRARAALAPGGARGARLNGRGGRRPQGRSPAARSPGGGPLTGRRRSRRLRPRTHPSPDGPAHGVR